MSCAQWRRTRILRAPRHMASCSFGSSPGVRDPRGQECRLKTVKRGGTSENTSCCAVTPPRFGPHSMVFKYISRMRGVVSCCSSRLCRMASSIFRHGASGQASDRGAGQTAGYWTTSTHKSRVAAVLTRRSQTVPNKNVCRKTRLSSD